jgi:hypothetical protein
VINRMTAEGGVGGSGGEAETIYVRRLHCASSGETVADKLRFTPTSSDSDPRSFNGSHVEKHGRRAT